MTYIEGLGSGGRELRLTDKFFEINWGLILLLCLAAGIWLLSAVGFDHGDEALWTAIGLYFVGKAFFVGPMLILATRQ